MPCDLHLTQAPLSLERGHRPTRLSLWPPTLWDLKVTERATCTSPRKLSGTSADRQRGPDNRREGNRSDTTDLYAMSRYVLLQAVAATGEIWKQWGWEVIERDGFDKPNRFGYSPDGYILQIQARPDRTQPPSLIGSSPCFPGDRRDDTVRRPPLIRQESG